MDASGRCGERLQVPERPGGTETLFLCAAASEFLARGGFVYPNPAEPGDDGDGTGARGACARRESGPLRGDHAAGTSRSLDIAAAGSGNSGRDLGWFGAAARCHRTVWRDVLCSVAEHTRAGAAHGAWRRRLQSVAAGDVAWLGVDGSRCGPWRHGGAWVDAAAWEPLVQNEPPRSPRVRVRVRGDGHRRAGSV